MSGYLLARNRREGAARHHPEHVQSYLDREWEAYRLACNAVFYLAPGCAAAGLEAFFREGELLLRWRTAFLPAPPHPIPESRVVPLGFFGRYTLYATEDGREAPALAARHWSDECAVWTPFHACPEPERHHAEAMTEAWRRAVLVNAFGRESAVALPERHAWN